MSNKSKLACCYAIVAVVLTAAGCGSVQQPHQSIPLPMDNTRPPTASSQRTEEINKALSAASQQSSGFSRDYRLGPDDLVQITIYNIPEQEARITPRTVTLRVSQDGIIVLPLIGSMEVRGKTTAEPRARFEPALHKIHSQPSGRRLDYGVSPARIGDGGGTKTGRVRIDGPQDRGRCAGSGRRRDGKGGQPGAYLSAGRQRRAAKHGHRSNDAGKQRRSGHGPKWPRVGQYAPASRGRGQRAAIGNVFRRWGGGQTGFLSAFA